MPNDEQLVSGELVFGEGNEGFSEATAYVRLEEVSRADAPSRVVAEQVTHHVSYKPGQPGKLVFNLRGLVLDEHARYTVSAHLDVDGDGQISRGDYISMESFPVLTQGYPSVVIVRLRKVK